MKLKLSTPSIVAVNAVLCSVAQAQFAVNYEVPGSYGATQYSGQGAYSDPGNNYWNTIPGSGGTTGGGFGDLLSDGATSTSITLSLSSYQTYNNGEQGAQGTPGGLLAPFILENNGTPVTGTFNNVAAGTYDLYLYGYNYPDGDRGTTFTASVGGTSYGSLSTVGLNVDAAGGTTTETAFTSGVDYVEFTGLDLTQAGAIDFTFAANTSIDRTAGLGDYSGSNGEGDFNGAQLVQVVPEPSTMTLAGLGGFCGFLIAMRRRRLCN
jgi:hypothetical protein